MYTYIYIYIVYIYIHIYTYEYDVSDLVNEGTCSVRSGLSFRV